MKTVCFSLIGLTIITTVMAALPVSAQEAVMTDAHISRIRNNCQQARVILTQIRSNDALTYINRNQAYYSIGDKLMARMNSRLALGRYDVAQLVKTTSDYTAALTKFRESFKVYADHIDDILKMDCRKQPVEFYDRVADAREKRMKVHETVLQLKASIDQYEESLISFKLKHFTQPDGGSRE